MNILFYIAIGFILGSWLTRKSIEHEIINKSENMQRFEIKGKLFNIRKDR